MGLRSAEWECVRRFRRRLRDSGEGIWEVGGTEVPVGVRNFDCERRCTSGSAMPIAVEITELFPVDYRPDAVSRDDVAIKIIRAALESAGCTGFEIRLFRPDDGVKKWAESQSNEILKAFRQDPSAREIETSGALLTRRDYFDGVNSFLGHLHGQVLAGPEWSHVRPALLRALGEKRDQLPSSGYRRVLLTHSDRPISADSVIEASSLIRFEHYPEFDQVYFANRCGRVSLVFDQAVLRSWNSGRFPEDNRLENLFSWFTFHRLNAAAVRAVRMPGSPLTPEERHAVEIVWQLTCERGHRLDWLPEDPGLVIQFLADRIISDSGFEAPGHWLRVLRNNNHEQSHETQEALQG